jgi:hypothetical protein
MKNMAQVRHTFHENNSKAPDFYNIFLPRVDPYFSYFQIRNFITKIWRKFSCGWSQLCLHYKIGKTKHWLVVSTF